MNHKRRSALIFAAMLGAGIFSGCGDTQQQTADTRSMIAEQDAAEFKEEIRADINGDGAQDAADAQLLLQYYTENVLAGNGVSWADLIGPENTARAEEAAAKRALTAYLEAAKAGDTLKALEVSGLGDVMRMTMGNIKTNEELVEKGDLKINKIDSYTIGTPRQDEKKLAEYQEQSEKSLTEARELIADQTTSASDLRTAFLVASLVKPMTNMYLFPVTVTIEGKTSEEEIPIVCDDKGDWRMDGGIAASLVSYVNKSRKTAANTAAKNVTNAVNFAAADLDSMYVNIRLLDGDYTFTGADFADLSKQANIGASSDKEQLLAMFKYYVSVYFNDIISLKTITFRLQNGVCIAAAVEQESSGHVQIGTYPILSSIPDGMTVAEALQEAAGKY